MHRLLKIFPQIFPLAAAVSLSACSAVDRLENIGQAPALQPVGNPAGTDIVAAIPRPQPIMHVDNSLWQPGAQSFFHDPRAMHVGDVITVNVTVADAAKPAYELRSVLSIRFVGSGAGPAANLVLTFGAAAGFRVVSKRTFIRATPAMPSTRA